MNPNPKLSSAPSADFVPLRVSASPRDASPPSTIDEFDAKDITDLANKSIHELVFLSCHAEQGDCADLEDISECLSNVRKNLDEIEAISGVESPEVGSALRAGRQSPSDVDIILSCVAEATGVPRSVLVCHSRPQSVVWPRHMAMYLCRQFTALTLQQIGQVFGRRDHSAVSHAITSVTATLANDAPRAARARNLSATIQERLTQSQ